MADFQSNPWDDGLRALVPSSRTVVCPAVGLQRRRRRPREQVESVCGGGGAVSRVRWNFGHPHPRHRHPCRGSYLGEYRPKQATCGGHGDKPQSAAILEEKTPFPLACVGWTLKGCLLLGLDIVSLHEQANRGTRLSG